MKNVKNVLLILISCIFSSVIVVASAFGDDVDRVYLLKKVVTAPYNDPDCYDLSDYLKSSHLKPIIMTDEKNEDIAILFEYDNGIVFKAERALNVCLEGTDYPKLDLFFDGTLSLDHFSTKNSFLIKAKEMKLRGTGEVFNSAQILIDNEFNNESTFFANHAIVTATTFLNQKGARLRGDKVELKDIKKLDNNGIIDAEDITSIQTDKLYNGAEAKIIAQNLISVHANIFYDFGMMLSAGICLVEAKTLHLYGQMMNGPRCRVYSATTQNGLDIYSASVIHARNIKLFSKQAINIRGQLFQGEKCGLEDYIREKQLQKMIRVSLLSQNLEQLYQGEGVEITSLDNIRKFPGSQIKAFSKVTYNAPRMTIDGKTSTFPFKGNTISIRAQNEAAIKGYISAGDDLNIWGNAKIEAVINAAGTIRQISLINQINQ